MCVCNCASYWAPTLFTILWFGGASFDRKRQLLHKLKLATDDVQAWYISACVTQLLVLMFLFVFLFLIHFHRVNLYVSLCVLLLLLCCCCIDDGIFFSIRFVSAVKRDYSVAHADLMTFFNVITYDNDVACTVKYYNGI